MRTGIQRLGRLLLALPFVLGGADVVREPGARVDQVAAAGMPAAEKMVRANGIIMMAAGIFLALGRLPRWAAAMLVLVLVPTTLVGHAFWRETTPQRREGQLGHFVKNLAMIGGLLSVLTEPDETESARAGEVQPVPLGSRV